MKEAALWEKKISSLIRIFYLIHVWKGHGLMAHIHASYCAGYELGCPITTDKWIEYEQ